MDYVSIMEIFKTIWTINRAAYSLFLTSNYVSLSRPCFDSTKTQEEERNQETATRKGTGVYRFVPESLYLGVQ